MHAMIRWCDQHAIEPPKLADMLGVDPELVNKVDRVDRQKHLERHAEQEQRQIKDPGEQEAGTGLAQRRGQVVVLALMMHRMRRPQYRDLMTAAMRPVVTKIKCQ